MLKRKVEELPKAEFIITKAQDRSRDMMISDAIHCALGGGARSGKTFIILRQMIVRALRSPGSRHAIFRFRFNALKQSVVLDTLPKVMALCFPGVQVNLNKTDWFLTVPGGSEIWFGGLDDKERTEKILGMEFATIYFNECSQIPYASVILALTRLAQKTSHLKLKVFYDFNPPSKMHWTYLLFVEKKNPMDKVVVTHPLKYGLYMINPMDNQVNLDPDYIEFLKSLPEASRKRFLYGQFADDSEGALWTVELLAQNRVLRQAGTLPDFLRICVNVDPSGCMGPEDTRSDKIGITVTALGTNGHGYLLEDLSGHYRPETWGKIACDAYDRHSADMIVGEVNYGGDMVRAVIQAENENVPFTCVTATRGKVIRAQPIASLYEQNRIHHIGHFTELEDQLCSMLMSGYVGITSPDAADSAIWGFTHLFPQMTKKTDKGHFVPPHVNLSSRSAKDRAKRQARRI